MVPCLCTRFMTGMPTAVDRPRDRQEGCTSQDFRGPSGEELYTTCSRRHSERVSARAVRDLLSVQRRSSKRIWPNCPSSPLRQPKLATKAKARTRIRETARKSLRQNPRLLDKPKLLARARHAHPTRALLECASGQLTTQATLPMTGPETMQADLPQVASTVVPLWAALVPKPRKSVKSQTKGDALNAI